MIGTERSNDGSYTGKKVLVTGADGFIGSHLTEQLVEAGADVSALCLYNSFDTLGWIDELPNATRTKLTVVRGDVRDSAFMRRIVAGQEIVFHLAALIAIPHSYAAAQSYVDTNVTGTLNVLEAAREFSVERIVQTSTSEVYGTAITVPISEDHPLQGQSPYSASKIGADMLSESFARSFEVPVAILRPFNTFGPRQSERAVIPTVIRQMLDPVSKSIDIGDVTPIRDFTFVMDTAAAFIAIGASRDIEYGRPYNAGTGIAVTVAEVIERLRAITDCQKPLKQDAVRLRPPRSEVQELLADASTFSKVTGWHPQVSLDDGLEQTVAWWRNRLAGGRARSEVSYAT
jgi:UDP-glucose 4-epimerase